MKKILLLSALFIGVSETNAQFIYKIKADSLLVTNDSCSAELNLENSTKSIKGFLYNKGNGRTEFRRGAIKLNDSTYLVGADTIKTSVSGGGNGGETNTASNTGTVGTGLFKQKSGVNLEFYKINPLSNRLSIALNGTDRVDLDVNESNLTIGNLSGSLPTTKMPGLTGDVTSTAGTAATTIANDVVSYGKMQNISTTQRVLGRNSAGSGDPEEITFTQFLDWVGSAAQGDILYRGTSSWTRLPAGTSGQILQTNGAGANPTWVNAPSGSGGFTVVKKISDENRSSTTTLTNDGALTISLAASTTYHIRGKIFLNTANATMDYKYALAYSGSTTSIMCKRAHVVAGATAGTGNENTVAQNTIIGSTSVTANTSGIAYVEIDVIIVTNATGTFSFQWAQNTSNGSNLTVLGGSYLEYSQFSAPN